MKLPASQQGATLIITLTILVVILLLGASSVRLRSLEEHAARNHQGLLQARLAAQAALDDALVDLRDNRWGGEKPLRRSEATELGRFSRMRAQFDAHRLPPPRYAIEWIEIREWRRRDLYRVSAWGFGAGGARAAVQMLVRRQQSGDDDATLDVVGWRRGRWP
ncbi:PilX N-terminal domain-containing pilus assembly protein [Herbaspirillum sp. alder98]|uniref:PilX N-terminal domain-containing pilus assembly protein n=1 Tax=Herbaspirillum sp. alder98 TaxID=2913096 RepID=UPI001CD87954|nr:PilX N-terminal domain-containing pilus assembly protein [Herbaspirillum sp. alder98]MCA1324868.1 hypothetical protein [Herbaspirillum sp. alder98]